MLASQPVQNSKPPRGGTGTGGKRGVAASSLRRGLERGGGWPPSRHCSGSTRSWYPLTLVGCSSGPCFLPDTPCRIGCCSHRPGEGLGGAGRVSEGTTSTGCVPVHPAGKSEWLQEVTVIPCLTLCPASWAHARPRPGQRPNSTRRISSSMQCSSDGLPFPRRHAWVSCNSVGNGRVTRA